MMNPARRTTSIGHGNAPGYTLVEMMIAMAITTLIMGATLAGLDEAMKANTAVTQLTTMNNGLRTAMDLMVRDILQTGSGLPKGHAILTASGGSLLIKRPGPPGTSYTYPSTNLNMPAVMPGPGLGPTINGVATDIITILTADNNFTDVPLNAVGAQSVTVAPGVDISSGPDRVIPGQLLMVLKGTSSTLAQVTDTNPSGRVIHLQVGDSLNLNQVGGGIVGNLASLHDMPPNGGAAAAATRITRVRMISYYLDNTTSPGHPRLVRRINNGQPTGFDNNLGTAVALDVEGLRFTYDLNDGASNPANVRFVAADYTTSGACAPDDCSPTLIRKVNITLTGRSSNATLPGSRVYRNTLTSQIALRGMAFVNDYQN